MTCRATAPLSRPSLGRHDQACQRRQSGPHEIFNGWRASCSRARATLDDAVRLRSRVLTGARTCSASSPPARSRPRTVPGEALQSQCREADMAAVIGYLVAASIAIAAGLRVARVEPLGLVWASATVTTVTAWLPPPRAPAFRPSRPRGDRQAARGAHLPRAPRGSRVLRRAPISRPDRPGRGA
jgi:hypothetical protein